jgi:hypothetical protein
VSLEPNSFTSLGTPETMRVAQSRRGQGKLAFRANCSTEQIDDTPAHT